MRAIRLAFGFLGPTAVVSGAALVGGVMVAVLVVAVAHRCAQPFPPEAVVVPLAGPAPSAATPRWPARGAL